MPKIIKSPVSGENDHGMEPRKAQNFREETGGKEMIMTNERPIHPADDETKGSAFEEALLEGPDIQDDEDEDDDTTAEIRAYEPIAEGPCEFAIISARILKGVETDFGVKDKVQFTFRVSRPGRDGEMTKDVLKFAYNVSTNPKSYLMVFLTQLGMPKPSKRLNCRDYMGIIGRAEVVHIKTDSGETIAVLQNFRRRLSD